MTAPAAPLAVARRDHALWLTLDRPGARNGLDLDLVRALGAGLDAARADPDVHAVVIAAAGDVFCAGADLKLVAAMAAAGTEAAGLQRDFLAHVRVLFDRIEAFPKPVIAAVQGLAVAGGLELVLVCDIVVAARSARFGDAHANVGLLPGGGATLRLPQRVGPSLARYLMFTGVDLPAAELAHTDLVTLLVDDDQLECTVQRTVERIAAKSVPGLARTKQLLRDAARSKPDAALDAEADALAAHARTGDFAEGLAAFLEKRRPSFTDRGDLR